MVSKKKNGNKRKSTYLKRKGLMEDSYIGGVKDKHGNYAIRPMTEEEIEFLNKFNDEFVNTNFKKDGTDLHQSLIDKNKPIVEEIKNKLSIARSDLKALTGYRESPDRLGYIENRNDIIREIQALQDELLEYDIIKAGYKSDYGRGKDPLNYKGTKSFNIKDAAKRRLVKSKVDSSGYYKNADLLSEEELFDALQESDEN